MNIFVLDFNPRKAAQMHCDKHVIKMIVETAQILSTVHWNSGSKAPYKPTHRYHPCVVWAQYSIDNYRWLVRLGLELCAEYTYRYNKIHKTQEVLFELSEREPLLPFCGAVSSFALAMPEQYHFDCPVQSYRKYYRDEKAHFAKYTNRDKPFWL